MPDPVQARPGGDRRLLWGGIGWLLLGLSPILASYLSSATASALGCYIAEYSTYSRSGTYGDFSDDVPGCRLGPVDLGPFLADVHTSAFAIFLTWPFILLSLLLFARLLVRILRRRQAEEHA